MTIVISHILHLKYSFDTFQKLKAFYLEHQADIYTPFSHVEYEETLKNTGVYFIPKKTLLNSTIDPNADMVARYRFISKGDNIDGFYGGNSFANQIGITTQVPRVVEIVSNNTNSSDREVRIGNRRFYVRKPIVQITKENVYVLQMLEKEIAEGRIFSDKNFFKKSAQ